MDVNPEVQALAVELAASLAKNSARLVADKVTALKKGNNDAETINGLEELINELIEDKNELIRIAQVYQTELVAQRLTSGDIQYLTSSVVPLIEKLASASPTGNPAQTQQMIELVKPILSVETVNVLQLLGFNFRSAIGQPLTQLVERLILSKSAPIGASTEELKKLDVQRENLLLQLSLDPDAYERFMKLVGRQ